MFGSFDKVVDKFATDLDAVMLRNRLISSNIANLDTPGYKSKDIDFNKVLSSSMDSLEVKRTNSRHLGNTSSGNLQSGDIIVNPNPGRPDGNNVDIDDEMLKLSENSIQYNTVIQFVSRKLRGMSDAIQQAK